MIAIKNEKAHPEVSRGGQDQKHSKRGYYTVIPTPPGWTPSQLQRRQQVESGLTVVASLRRDVDTALIQWANQARLAVRIDRRSKWGNPYPMKSEADRASVCDRYADHLATCPDLLAQIGELRGRVLLCWCHPKHCHGDTLARMANGQEVGA